MDKAVIKNLNRLKKYAIRVLISDEETKIKKLYFNNLPYTICNTTCNGINTFFTINIFDKHYISIRMNI